MTAERLKDPDNYRKMSEPFATADDANASLRAFHEDVRAARQKHRIADVLIVACVNVIYDSGEGAAINTVYHGDSLKAEGLAAFAYGREQADRRETINRLLSGKK